MHIYVLEMNRKRESARSLTVISHPIRGSGLIVGWMKPCVKEEQQLLWPVARVPENWG